MKKCLLTTICIVLILSLFGYSKNKEVSPFDIIKDSVVAKMETQDNTIIYIDSEIDNLKSIGYMEFAVLEDPDSMEEYWIYRITYNPSEKVKNSTEVVVLFYGDYLKVNSKCYTFSDDVEYKEILSWAKSKFDYFSN